MLAIFAIPALLGLGFAYEFLSEDEDETTGETETDPPLQVSLGNDIITFEGTDDREHVEGNAQDNFMLGGKGNDKLSGSDGNDTIDSGAGNDRIFAGSGDDEAAGGKGNDRIFLGDGNDSSGTGAYGSDAGNDLIRGGAGHDHIIDGLGSNEIHGDTGRDVISTLDREAGQITPDRVHGGYGSDTLVGDAGDYLEGGEGPDSFVIAARDGITDAPAMLIDFDVREDLLSVVMLEDADTPPEITFQHLQGSNQLAAMVNGYPVALLNDIEAEDVPFIRTFVTSLTDLAGYQAA